MVKNDYGDAKRLLQELEKNKLVKYVAESLHEQAKMHIWNTLLITSAVLITILALNWWGKLSSETNGWLLAALVGYLFGRGVQR